MPPPRQLTQAAEPGDEAAKLAGQLVHEYVAAPAVRNEPAGQGAHDNTLELAAYVPFIVQLEQLVEPASEKRPVGHAVQEVLPADPEIVPAGQAVHNVDAIELE